LELLVIKEGDWRWNNGGAYLNGLALVRRGWRETRPEWDHDHCEMCLTKFGDERIPDALNEGYTTEDEYRWICDTCFNDFRAFYNWRLLDGS